MSYNTFKQNAAYLGGAIYCYYCYYYLMSSNTFYNNIAYQGGDMYADRASTYPVTISDHQHSYSYAINRGGAIYFKDGTTISTSFVI